MHAVTVSECSIWIGLGTPHFRGGGGGGQQVGEACTRCTECCEKWVFELYFLFCLSWTRKWNSAYSFLSLGSYLNMYHGYPSLEKEHFLPVSLKKEHFLPVFTEKRALFEHILRDAKSTKCELKEHLWERATTLALQGLHWPCPGLHQQCQGYIGSAWGYINPALGGLHRS